MARPKRSKPPRRCSGPRRRSSDDESRAVELVTTSWMMAVVMAVFCELGAAAAFGFLRWRPGVVKIEVLSGMLLFASVVIGAVSLFLMLVVWAVRPIRPPTSVMVFSATVGIAPLFVVILLLLR